MVGWFTTTTPLLVGSCATTVNNDNDNHNHNDDNDNDDDDKDENNDNHEDEDNDEDDDKDAPTLLAKSLSAALTRSSVLIRVT